MSLITSDELQVTYVTFFARPADKKGNEYWVQQEKAAAITAADQGGIEENVNAFGDSDILNSNLIETKGVNTSIINSIVEALNQVSSNTYEKLPSSRDPLPSNDPTTIVNTPGVAPSNGTDDDDYIHSTGLVHGYAGNDVIYGDLYFDEIWGGIGNDKIYGLSGDDYIHGDEGNILGEYDDGSAFYVNGNDGNDIIYGGAGNDRIFGDGGNDEIHGGEDDDYIVGGAGDDVIYGDDGNDLIYGNDGNDLIYGGAGEDTFVIERTAKRNGKDTIGDFSVTEDILSFNYDGKIIITQNGNDSQIYYNSVADENLVAILEGVNSSDLTQANFVGVDFANNVVFM